MENDDLLKEILDINKIKDTFYKITLNTKHRDKLYSFKLFYTASISNIYNSIKNKTYRHGKYNVFLINDPKYRVIMSEKITDKVVNHLLSDYILKPLIEPRLIETNVATRENKGLKEAQKYTTKYINHLKRKYDNFYILKCDIHKYFYSINHKILLDKLKRIIKDEDVISLIEDILASTYDIDTNNYIEKILEEEKSKPHNKNRIEELNKIPLYKDGVGLPIGNMSSQIFAIYYLNDLDHFIKEQLHIKYYIRYMLCKQ